MSRGAMLKTVFILTAIGLAGCTSDDVVFFPGDSPINAVAISKATLSPDNDTFQVTRGTAFNYSMDVHYDFRNADFASPTVELAAFGGTLDASGNFVRSSICNTRNLKNQVVTTQSGDLHWTGSYTLPVSAACAPTTYLELVVFMFSSTKGVALESYSVYYRVK